MPLDEINSMIQNEAILPDSVKAASEQDDESQDLEGLQETVHPQTPPDQN